MPALVVLERLPAPTLAVDREGTILFANGAFSDMLGHAPDELLAMKFSDIFCIPATHHSAVVLVRAHPDRLVQLAHADGHPVTTLVTFCSSCVPFANCRFDPTCGSEG